MTSILSLPDDCFWNVLSFILLDPKTGPASINYEYDVDSILAFSLCCRKFSVIVEDMPVWREACLKRWKHWTNMKKPVNMLINNSALQQFPPNPLSFDHPLSQNQYLQQNERTQQSRNRTLSFQSTISTSSSYKNWKLTYLNRHNIDRKLSLFLQNVVSLGYDRLFYWQRIVSMDWEAVDYLIQIKERVPEWEDLTFKHYARTALHKIKRRMLVNRWKCLINCTKSYESATESNLCHLATNSVLIFTDIESITCPNYLSNCSGTPPIEEGAILMSCFQYPDLDELELRSKLHFLGLLCQSFFHANLNDSTLTDDYGFLSSWKSHVSSLNLNDVTISLYHPSVLDWSKRAKDLICIAVSLKSRITLLNSFMYEECGFQGNKEDFYDVKNSFINDILNRRLGIPIALSVIYSLLGRYIGLDVEMIGFPNHFLVAVKLPGQQGSRKSVTKIGALAASTSSNMKKYHYDYSGSGSIQNADISQSVSSSSSFIIDGQSLFASYIYIDCFNEGRVMEEQAIRQRLEEMGISVNMMTPAGNSDNISAQQQSLHSRHRSISPSESMESVHENAAGTSGGNNALTTNIFNYLTPANAINCWLRLLRNLSLVCQSRRGNYVNTHYKVISQILLLSPDLAEYGFQKFQLIQNFFREDVDELEDLFGILGGGAMGAALTTNNSVITGDSPIPRPRTLSESSSTSRGSRSASTFLDDRLPVTPITASNASPIVRQAGESSISTSSVNPLAATTFPTTANNSPPISINSTVRNFLSNNSGAVPHNGNHSAGIASGSTSPRPTTPPMTSSFASLPPFSPSHPTMVLQSMLKEMNSNWRDRPIKRRVNSINGSSSMSSNAPIFFVGQCVYVSRRSISAVIVGWDSLLEPFSLNGGPARQRISYWVLMDQGEKRAVMESSLNREPGDNVVIEESPPWNHDEIGKYFDEYCKIRKCFILNPEYRLIYPDDAEYAESLLKQL